MLQTIIINLLLINVIMSLIHLSGFIENMDNWVESKFKFHHLPYPVRCCLCGTWWLSLLFIIVTGNLSLLNIALCLVNAHLTKITIPLFTTIENMIMKIIELVNWALGN